MTYNFTKRLDKRGTGSDKWNAMLEENPQVAEGVVPMSEADMEFVNAPEIKAGLKEFIENYELGYTHETEDYLNMIRKWQKEQHGVDLENDWIVTLPGVVTAFTIIMQQFSEVGDGVINFTPVYYPFRIKIEENNRKNVTIPLLKDEDNYYQIDFAAFEEAAKKPENKLLFFCSPHNPVGRVWTKEELEEVARIAKENDLIVFSDEIWQDLTSPDHPFISFMNVENADRDKLIVATAASKSFSIAGERTSHAFIPNADLRASFEEGLAKNNNSLTVLGYATTYYAYRDAGPWLDEVKKVIEKNQQVAHDFFKEHLPMVKAPISEGTYVMWADFRELGMDHQELEKFMAHKAQAFFSQGYVFGVEGQGFLRLNLALPTEILVETLERIVKALKEDGYI